MIRGEQCLTVWDVSYPMETMKYLTMLRLLCSAKFRTKFMRDKCERLDVPFHFATGYYTGRSFQDGELITKKPSLGDAKDWMDEAMEEELLELLDGDWQQERVAEELSRDAYIENAGHVCIGCGGYGVLRQVEIDHSLPGGDGSHPLDCCRVLCETCYPDFI